VTSEPGAGTAADQAADHAAGPPGARPEALQRIDGYERGLDVGLLSRPVQQLGRTRAFSAVYRRVGPRLDPVLLRSARGRAVLRRFGFPWMLLATTGARTGLRRETPLLYVRDGDRFACVGTNFGQPKHPAWTANLRADPTAWVTVGDTTVEVRAEQVTDPAVAQPLWDRLVAVYPGYADYLPRRADLPPRMFLLHPQG
jgi:deazaflavin-dependent oxidoreductase (nitroreductase family)